MSVGASDVRTLGIELTEICNFACIHCYLERVQQPKLCAEQLDRVADAADLAGFSAVYLTGGEPTMHPEFVDIYSSFRSRGFITSIYSNASHLSRAARASMMELAPAKYDITLYGMSEETYSRTTRRRGMFSRVVENIEWLAASRINVQLKMPILTTTLGDVEAFLEFGATHQISTFLNAEIIPTLAGDMSPLAVRPPSEEIRALETAYGLKFFDSTPPRMEDCDAGRNLFIDHNGIVRGCPVLKTPFDVALCPGSELTSLNSATKSLARFQNDRSIPLCPAWIELEGEASVRTFLGNGIAVRG